MESHRAQLNVLELPLSVGLEKTMGDLKPLYNRSSPDLIKGQQGLELYWGILPAY